MRLPGQTVYSKALAIFVLLSFLLGAAIVSMSQYLILGKFRQTERKEMLGSMNRLSLVLDSESSRLASALDLWAAGPQAGRVGSRQETGFDFLAERNPGGEISVLSLGRDSPAAETVLRKVLKGTFGDTSGRDRAASGFIALGDRLALVAWKPVPGDSGSIYIVGRTLGGTYLAFLESLFSGVIRFELMVNRVIGPAGSEDLVELLSGGEPIVEQFGEDKITGTLLVRGLDRAPLGLLSLAQKPALEREGETTVQIFLTVMALAGGFFFFFIWVLMDRTILARIRELTRQVELEKQKGRLPVKLAFAGADELGTLARSIEELAVLLDKAQQQYRAVVEDQTEIICRFDQDLRITFANAVFIRAFCPQGTAHGRPLSDILSGQAGEFLARRFARLFPAHPIDSFQHRVENAEGKSVWLRSTLRANFQAGGAPAGGQWVAADVSLQVEAEKGIQDSERQLRALSNRLLHLQDEERRRIARELHDSTAQNLSALEMHVSLLDPLARDARTRKIVDETRRIARDCCQELRSISYLLHPPLLDEVGLAFAVRWFVDGFGERTGIDIDLEIPGDFPRLDPELETALFRVVQEASANIYKHSGAETGSILLAREEGGDVRLVIRDNGRGFPPARTEDMAEMANAGTPPRPGIGLAGMRERVRQFEGQLDIDNSPSGVTISVRIPAHYARPCKPKDQNPDR